MRCLSVVRLVIDPAVNTILLVCPTCGYSAELGHDLPIDTALEAECDHDERGIPQ